MRRKIKNNRHYHVKVCQALEGVLPQNKVGDGLIKAEVADQLDSLWLAVVVLPEAPGQALLVAVREFIELHLEVEVLKVVEVHETLKVGLGLLYRVDLLDLVLRSQAKQGGQGPNPGEV